MPKYASTWFCWHKEPQKMHGRYGINNGSTIPSGFVVGERIRVYTELVGHPTFEMVLTGETFTGSTLVLPDGRQVEQEDVVSVYRVPGS